MVRFFSHKSTCSCSPDCNGNSSRQSIESAIYKKGTTYLVHQALLWSSGRYMGQQIAVTKFLRAEDRSELWARSMVEVSRRARNVAKLFNTFVAQNEGCPSYDFSEEANDLAVIDGLPGKDGLLTVMVPQCNELGSVAVIKRSMNVGDWFLIEEKLKNYQTFIDREGKAQRDAKSRCMGCVKSPTRSRSQTSSISSNRSSPAVPLPVSALPTDLCPGYADQPPTYEDSQAHVLHGIPLPDTRLTPSAPPDLDPATNANEERHRSRPKVADSALVSHPFLQAFIHYSLHASQGRWIYSNLKGSRNKEDGSYVLSTPTVYSIKDDNGTNEMLQVISNHQCTRLCRYLPSMSDLLNKAIDAKSQA